MSQEQTDLVVYSLRLKSAFIPITFTVPVKITVDGTLANNVCFADEQNGFLIRYEVVEDKKLDFISHHGVVEVGFSDAQRKQHLALVESRLAERGTNLGMEYRNDMFSFGLRDSSN